MPYCVFLEPIVSFPVSRVAKRTFAGVDSTCVSVLSGTIRPIICGFVECTDRLL